MPRQKTINIGEEKIKLSERELMFCEYYLSDSDRNATKAAITVGYSTKTARQQAARLLSNVNIQKYLDFKIKPLLEKLGITQERILQEWANVGFSNVKNLLNNDYSIKDLDQIDSSVAGSISQIKVRTEKSEHGGENVTVELKVWDKLKALSELAEATGLKKKDSDDDSGNVKAIQNNYYGEINNYIKGQ